MRLIIGPDVVEFFEFANNLFPFRYCQQDGLAFLLLVYDIGWMYFYHKNILGPAVLERFRNLPSIHGLVTESIVFFFRFPVKVLLILYVSSVGSLSSALLPEWTGSEIAERKVIWIRALIPWLLFSDPLTGIWKHHHS